MQWDGIKAAGFNGRDCTGAESECSGRGRRCVDIHILRSGKESKKGRVAHDRRREKGRGRCEDVATLTLSHKARRGLEKGVIS